jgi:activator of HSP90 ATPase
MPTIEKSYLINASPEDVFEALVNPDLIQNWSGDEAKMEAVVGAEFSLWSGQMFGKNLVVERNKKLVQQWCYEQWSEPSQVTITIKPKGKISIVTLLHENVPEKSLTSISDGWDSYYFGAIEEMLSKGKNAIHTTSFQHNIKNVL